MIKEEDNEPVYYCKDCLSLKVIGDLTFSFCDECSSVNIGEAMILEWLEMYKNKYGKNYLEDNNGKHRD